MHYARFLKEFFKLSDLVDKPPSFIINTCFQTLNLVYAGVYCLVSSCFLLLIHIHLEIRQLKAMSAVFCSFVGNFRKYLPFLIEILTFGNMACREFTI